MGAVTKLFVITLLAIVCTNGAYVDNYVPMDLTKFREETSETTTTTPLLNKSSEETKVTSNESQNSEESKESRNEKSTEENPIVETKTSEENASGDLERKKKSATTTFCVEIRPSNPYQKPFQVCEPAYPGYKAPTHQQQQIYQQNPIYHHPKPTYHQQQPHVHRPVSYQPTHSVAQGYGAPVKKPQTGYAAPPSYGQQPASAGGNSYVQPLSIAPEYRPPSVMVVPHVPVAEPYHVPEPQIRPGSGVYRTNMDWEFEDVDVEDSPDARTAYNSYESHEPYGHGKTIYKYEKDKKIDYLPVLVKTTKKTKPLKFLKVYKDIKKGKLKLYDDAYDGDEYGGHGYGDHGYGGHGGHEYGGHEYGGHEYGGHEYEGHEHGGHGYGGHGFGHESDIGHHAGGNQHGLVITCQPSAVGYAGGQTEVELQRHMDLLKNIYSASEKIFSGAPKTEYGPGLVAHSGYGVSGGAAHSAGVATSVSSGFENSYVPPSTYRNSEAKNWEQAAQMRSSNGEYWKQSEPSKWEAKSQMNMNENVGKSMNIPSSAQPMMMASPTENVQKQLETTASFRANRV